LEKAKNHFDKRNESGAKEETVCKLKEKQEKSWKRKRISCKSWKYELHIIK
jgi:hypothetical protein